MKKAMLVLLAAAMFATVGVPCAVQAGEAEIVESIQVDFTAVTQDSIFFSNRKTDGGKTMLSRIERKEGEGFRRCGSSPYTWYVKVRDGKGGICHVISSFTPHATLNMMMK